MSAVAFPCHLISVGQQIARKAAIGKNLGQIPEQRFALPHRSCRKLWLADTHAAFTKVLLASFDLFLELVGELQLVFKNIVQPVQKRFSVSLGQLLHLFFNLF
jgi:hypothetical protein